MTFTGNKVIGILGGMGPQAGVDLHEKVIQESGAKTDQDHFNLVHLAFPAGIADRTAFLNGTSQENPAAGIFEVLCKMERIGVNVAGMPCNTAHSPNILGKVHQLMQQQGLKLKFLDMVQEVMNHLGQHLEKGTPVGILATAGTCQTGLYDDALCTHDFRPVKLAADLQARLVDEAIYKREFGLKAHSNPVQPEAVGLLSEAVFQLKGQGAKLVLLACTELPLALTSDSLHDVALLDATRVLARALVREARQ